MKSLKGRYIKSNIQMVIISTTFVFVITFLAFFVFMAHKNGGEIGILKLIGTFFLQNKHTIAGSKAFLYGLLWTSMISLAVIVTCTAFSVRFSKSIIAPVEELKTAAENLKDGNLNFEIMSCRDTEFNDLAIAMEEIRKRLKANVEKDLLVERERNMLMANISHDMRTPITTIKGYLEGIRDGVASSPEKMELYLGTIYNKALVLETLVDNMTEYSELELGRMQYVFEYVNLTAYLNDLVEEYERELEHRKLSLSYDFVKTPLIVVADRNKLKRVLDNLISNAIKYNKEDGSIFLRLQSDEKGALLCISDTGRGIKKEDIDRVFSGFYRGDAARSNIKGNGLGLSICKQIIESHRGKIWIKSEENIGTEVFIYLPLRDLPPEQ